MWEQSAIAYLKEIGWYDRFLKITGSNNNAKVVKYYRDSVVGDSPENARVLDSYDFSDLEFSMSFHVAMTAALLPNDDRMFQLGTPNHVWRTLEPGSASNTDHTICKFGAVVVVTPVSLTCS
jgi:hypothetical protein